MVVACFYKPVVTSLSYSLTRRYLTRINCETSPARPLFDKVLISALIAEVKSPPSRLPRADVL